MDQFSFVEEPGSVPRLRLRAMDLNVVDQEITKANRHKGAYEINPEFANDLGLDQTKNIDSYDLHFERAGNNLIVACGKCAIRGCALRNDIEKWESKYHYSNKRHALIKKAVSEAEKGIETPC